MINELTWAHPSYLRRKGGKRPRFVPPTWAPERAIYSGCRCKRAPLQTPYGAKGGETKCNDVEAVRRTNVRMTVAHTFLHKWKMFINYVRTIYIFANKS